MGIDLETWRARIGLFHAASVGRYLRRQQRAAQTEKRVHASRWSNGELNMDCHHVPRLLVSFFVALLVKYVFEYVFQSSKYKGFHKAVLHSISRGMKLCRQVVTAASEHPLRSTVLALSLLLIVAGDVELNPGPVEDLNLKNLVNALSPVNTKWYEIGVQLTIASSKLREFDADQRGGCQKILSATLEFWLGGNTDMPISWQSVINALNSASVNERGLASQIQATYCQSTQSESSHCYRPCKEMAQSSDLKAINEGVKGLNNKKAPDPSSSTTQATPPSPDPAKSGGLFFNRKEHPGQKAEDVVTKEIPESSFPLLDKVAGLSPEQRKILETKLRRESREIMKNFYGLLATFCQSLCDRNFPLIELIRYLKRLKAYDPVEEIPEDKQKSVVEDHIQQLRNAKSIDDVFEVVEKYCSFFNYDIVTCMIEEFGTDNDKLELRKYTSCSSPQADKLRMHSAELPDSNLYPV